MKSEDDIKYEIQSMIKARNKVSGTNRARIDGFIKGLLFVLDKPLNIESYIQNEVAYEKKNKN